MYANFNSYEKRYNLKFDFEYEVLNEYNDFNNMFDYVKVSEIFLESNQINLLIKDLEFSGYTEVVDLEEYNSFKYFDKIKWWNIQSSDLLKCYQSYGSKECFNILSIPYCKLAYICEVDDGFIVYLCDFFGHSVYD